MYIRRFCLDMYKYIRTFVVEIINNSINNLKFTTMEETIQIIYLIIGNCYFSDDPDKVYAKEWHLYAYKEESEAWEKVEELRKKEQIRRANCSPDDYDYTIRNEYTVDKTLLYGKTEI